MSMTMEGEVWWKLCLDDEGAVHRESEFEKVQRTEERVAHHDDSTQYWADELLGMCRKVIYLTEPKGHNNTQLLSQIKNEVVGAPILRRNETNTKFF